jgi:fructan beta-fructosidase
LKNSKGNKAVFIFDLEKGFLTFDRSNSGQTTFHENFTDLVTAPLDFGPITEVDMVVDQSSIELMVNGGRLQMTNLVFPQELLNTVEVVESAQTKVVSLQVRGLKSIWK